VGYEGLYEVSDLGRVRTVATGLIRTPQYEPESGYARYQLHKARRRRQWRAHVLVLEAFVGPRPTPEHEGCHDNGDPADNGLPNLRWDTGSNNMLDVTRHGRNVLANREQCPREHDLAVPNLVPSSLPRRDCLACSRARGWIGNQVRKGLPKPDLQETSDRYYRKIMGH
jgi:hypothetical protein